MSKKQFLTPELILEDLSGKLRERGFLDVLPRLETAKALLPIMSKEQYDRPAKDVLAGTIATVIGMKCICRNPSAVIMVCEPEEMKKNTADLEIVLNALEELGYLPRTELAVRWPANHYLCLKRLDNARSNGHCFPASLQSRLTVLNLSHKTRDMICVKTCAKSCRYYSQCRFQSLRQKMRDGEIPFQIYSVQDYRNALRENQLPKCRMVVFEPRLGRLTAAEKNPALQQRELEKVLLQSERFCNPAENKKAAVFRETAAVREMGRDLFSLSPGNDAERLQELLASIHGGLERIWNLCDQELRLPGTERDKWRKGLKRLLEATAPSARSHLTAKEVRKHDLP